MIENKKNNDQEPKIVLQNEDSLISLLTTMQADPLNCKADIYWTIVKRGKALIPLLIEHLTDTTLTNVYDRCKNGKLNVGEISYFALQEIAEFPSYIVTNIQFDVFDNNDCWIFFDYFFNNSNKKEYQKMVLNFYSKNEFIFSKFEKNEMNECRKQYKIDGKLKWKNLDNP